MTSLPVPRPSPLKDIAAFILAALLLLWLPFVNGFPLLFADSGTYLRIGTELYFPYDRPVTYGLAIMPFHRLGGLWAVAIVQSLFTVWIIDRILRLILGHRSTIGLVGTAAALAAFTSLPWFAGQIMPDLFAGLVTLIAWLMLFGWEELPPWERWALPPLLTLIVAFHLSFVPTLAGVTVVGTIAGWALTRRVRTLKTGGIILGTIAVALLGLSALNLAARGQFRPSVSSNAFLLARVLDGHVAQPVIIEMCRTKRMILCRMDHVLDPEAELPGQYYLWTEYPAMTPAEIAHMPAEEAEIVRRVMHERPGDVTAMALGGFGQLLLLARAGDGMDPYGPEMQVSQQIAKHFPRAEAVWQGSLQQQGRLKALAIMPDRAIGLIAALFNVAILIAAIRRRETALAGLAAMIVATLILNALFCSVLSGVVERYQARIMWLPMLGLATAAIWWLPRRGANDDAA